MIPQLRGLNKRLAKLVDEFTYLTLSNKLQQISFFLITNHWWGGKIFPIFIWEEFIWNIPRAKLNQGHGQKCLLWESFHFSLQWALQFQQWFLMKIDLWILQESQKKIEEIVCGGGSLFFLYWLATGQSLESHSIIIEKKYIFTQQWRCKRGGNNVCANIRVALRPKLKKN